LVFVQIYIFNLVIKNHYLYLISIPALINTFIYFYTKITEFKYFGISANNIGDNILFTFQLILIYCMPFLQIIILIIVAIKFIKKIKDKTIE